MNNDLLNKIALDVNDWLVKECNKMTSNKYLREELFQEIMLIILTYKPESTLQEAYKKNEHLPFIKKIIMNQFKSKHSNFYNKFIKYNNYYLIDENKIQDNED